MLLLLLGACTHPTPPQPWKVALEGGLDEGLAACASYEGNVAGECAFGVLQTHHRIDEEGCALLEEGLYRTECLFLAAERLARAGEHERAAALCDRTRDTFRNNCAMHAWDQAVLSAIEVADPTGPSAASEVILAEATAAYGRGVLDPGRAVNDSFWWAWWKERRHVRVTDCATETCVQSSLTAASSFGFVGGCDSAPPEVCDDGDPACLAAVLEGRELRCDGVRARPGAPRYN